MSAASLLAACVAPTAPADSGVGESSSASSIVEIWAYPRTENDADIVFAPIMGKFAEAYPDITPEIEI